MVGVKMAAPAAASIRDRQTVALKRMLNFNVPHVKNSTGEPVWKVLIYDRFGQDIISPLLSVKELRDMGITLHLLLHSDRDPIPDVPAVYFVMPTEENIDRMCQDLRNQLYESYYLNFISAISRSKLEDIANAALAASAVTQVAKVFDQYLNFITLEDDMFVLCNQNKELVSYRAINRPDITDTEMETVMDTIVDSLFCFFVTLGAVPIIRCSRGTAAEMVAVDFHLNRVNLEESSGVENSPAGARPKRKNKKSYDLTPVDKFWQKHKGSPFPEVAESVQQELESYRAQEDEVKRLKSIMGLEGEDEGAISMLSDNTAKLTSAVSSLPELLEKKRLIDLHTNVATAVLEHIKARKLDVYFEYEEKIMSKTTLDKSLLDIISDPDAGTPEDKMRLFLIYYISAQQAPSEADLEQYKKALTDAGCNLNPLQYIKQWKAFAKMASAPASYGNTTTKPMGLLSRVMNTGSQFVMEGVKNLVLKQQNLPVTRILDNLMEMKSNPETDDYRYFDPKMLRGNDSSVPRNKNPFQEAIVFVVGGGNYIEYQNLVDYIKGKQGKHILYGCSELFNATQFIKQLSQLGQK
uniref:Sec1 family domain-containing protein 1 n=2 Tax=Canis lupus familiaris TaxID=9615 RepID=A0A8I3N5B6_CANLF